MESKVEALKVFAIETLFDRAEKAWCPTDIEEIKRVAETLGISQINDEIDLLWRKRSKQVVAIIKEIDELTDPQL